MDAPADAPADDVMDVYDAAVVPRPFGLRNSGSICYLNAFLQALASCSAFTRAVTRNADYVSQTRTGRAVLAFVRGFLAAREAGPAEAVGAATRVADHSVAVSAAFVADLAERRPEFRFQFGTRQESASEAFELLLDMLEPPGPEGDRGLRADMETVTFRAAVESPITRLFLHRYRCDLRCRRCRGVVSSLTDHAIIFNLFHIDSMRRPPATPEEFSKAVQVQASGMDDYACPACKTPTPALRAYCLTMVPEIVVVGFNQYVGYGGQARARYFPNHLKFPATDDDSLVFRIVGQVEHSGGLEGGHYWARALRADGRSYILNDMSTGAAPFAPTAGTYMVLYHYAGRASELVARAAERGLAPSQKPELRL
jgi:ubiquitin C-terminal hydrolase